MLIVIPTISFMVHLYSMGYMRDHHGVYEHGFQRFYAFLSLFSFSMLGLVVATNIFQMYIFWELVGASSYLLIGFYYKKPSAVSASKKAFIVTRFADLGFLIGILVLSYYTMPSTSCSSLRLLSREWRAFIRSASRPRWESRAFSHRAQPPCLWVLRCSHGLSC